MEGGPAGQTFELDTSVARRVYSNRRATRYISGAAAVIFLTIATYAAVELPRAIADNKDVAAYIFALVLMIFFAFVTASVAMIGAGRPARRLDLTSTGVALEFPSFPGSVLLRWSDPKFSMTVRDFRNHPTPASDIVQIERIGHAPFWLQAPTSPLTPGAFDALLIRARENGLIVMEKRGGTAFNAWPNLEITLRQAPRRGL